MTDSDNYVNISHLINEYKSVFHIKKIIKFHPDSEITSDVIIKQIASKLKNFQKGNYKKPGSGFFVKFQNSINKITYYDEETMNKIKENLSDVVEHSWFIYCIRENWGEIYKYKDESSTDFTAKIDNALKNIESSVVIWHLQENLLFIIGSEDNSELMKKEISRIVQDSKLGTLEGAMDFDPEFIFWLFWKNWDDKTITNEITYKISLISDVKTVGKIRDRTGKEIGVKDSVDAVKSIAVIIPILEGKSPESTKMSITFQESIYATIEIDIKGKLFVYQSLGDLNHISSEERYQMISYILIYFIKLYNYWLCLPKTEKYPSPSFIEQIFKFSQREGIEIYVGVPEVLKKYKELRDEG